MTAPAGYATAPAIQPPAVNQNTYTPKLGVMAEKTPAVNRSRTPEERKNDMAVAKAEKEARKAPPGSTVPLPTSLNQTTVIQSQTTEPVVETKTTTAVIQPTPDNVAAGIQPSTTVQTQTQTVPSAGSSDNIVVPRPQ